MLIIFRNLIIKIRRIFCASIKVSLLIFHLQDKNTKDADGESRLL